MDFDLTQRRASPGAGLESQAAASYFKRFVLSEDVSVNRHLIAGALLALTWGGASAQATGLAAKVNGVGIPQSILQVQVDQVVHNRKADYAMLATQPGVLDELRQQVLEQLITQELLWQEARRRGHVVEEELVDAQLAEIQAGFESAEKFEVKIAQGGFTIESFREDISKRMSVERMVSRDIANSIQVSGQDIDDFYAANLDQMVIPEQVRVSHIMVKAASGEDQALAAALAHARELQSLAGEGKDFAQLAREQSQAPSAKDGGDLGYIEHGSLAQPFEEAAFALPVGEISEPVKLGNDYHVIKVTARTGGNTVPRDQAAEQIEDYLTQQRAQQALGELLASLREDAEIEIY